MYHPKESLTWLFEFILERPDGIKDLVIENLIEQFGEELSNEAGRQANQVYKPRNGKVGQNLELFTEDQLKFIQEECGQNLKQLGYVLTDEQVANCEN